MISLRKAMDEDYETALHTAVDSYRRVVQAVGDAGARACPPVADPFLASLKELQSRVNSGVRPEVVDDTTTQIEAKLKHWGSEAAGVYEDRTKELKEILLIVAKATGELAARDQRYGKQFQDVTERLRSTSQLNDLTAIRQSLSTSVAEITACVNQMNKDRQDSMSQMRAQLATYESRLEEAERVACIDPLTRLTNRRSLELQLQRRITERQAFSVIFWDLNGFKAVNDKYGHPAGDELLQQVAAELRAAARAADVVGRWGGDEFVVIADSGLPDAAKYVARIEQWVAGSYTLKGVANKVNVTVAAGVANWEPGETMTQVLQRADAAMYARKAAMKSK